MLKNLMILLELNANISEKTNWPSIIGQFALLFFIVFVMIILAYFSIKATTKVRLKNQGKNNLEVIECISVSYQNYIQLIRVCEEYVLIGVNKDKITFLTKLDNPTIKIEDLEKINSNIVSFENYLQQHIRKIFKKD